MGLGRIKRPPADVAAKGVHPKKRGNVGRGIDPGSLTITPPPRCPTHLKGFARQEWKRVVPPLWLAGQVGPPDLRTLEMYCSSYARWREAVGMLESEGTVVEGRLGPKASPWLDVADKAETQLQRWAARFGLSTKDRAAMGESLRAIAAAKAHDDSSAKSAKPKPALAKPALAMVAND